MSAYAITAVEPGRGYRAQDLLRDRAAVEVQDARLSEHLEEHEIIAARIFEVRNRWRIGGVFLRLDDLALEELEQRLELLQAAASQQSRAMVDEATEALAEELGEGLLAAFADRDTLLSISSFLFTDIWLRQVIDDIFNAAIGRLVTRDGQPLERMNASYALAPETSEAALVEILGGLDILRRTDETDEIEEGAAAERLAWRIVDPAAPSAAPEVPREPDAPIVFDPRADDGAALVGEVTLEDRRLEIATSAKSHLERARALLEPVLRDCVRPPDIEQVPAPSRRLAGTAEG